MSATASSSKTTTTNTILYKRLKDVPHLSTIKKSDPHRTLSGFKAITEFTKRRDPTKNEEWEGYEKAERKVLVQGYWRAYDQEHNELDVLYLDLVRKEAAAESKRKSKEVKKKKSKPAAPIASGSGSGKGKEKVVEIIDSESEVDLAFRETCVGCERAKVKCVFMHATNSKKLQDLSAVPEDLQDGVFQNRSRIIERYNKIALLCGAQMKQLATRYTLGKSCVPQVLLLNRYGNLEFEEDMESGKKRGRDEEGDAGCYGLILTKGSEA
ncbi:hypothetical protein M422DRAFT_268645 [Sphaerobolus stellatus SS14]|uniref:Unplaced genomic scaffold SPHSTscaffold_198, whole genome shotgun sequence n=1 Tax=Sphaerobolus stellatus (strain SS14) TaxID=990650 RepID=A0A0C9UM44_SPHS4|nr:hypothetical protein M422DRAFT_268645 [Sphaerobolus stellatus SS14]